eukprot:4597667-Pleurochrysis_carterae.AAC.1
MAEKAQSLLQAVAKTSLRKVNKEYCNRGSQSYRSVLAGPAAVQQVQVPPIGHRVSVEFFFDFVLSEFFAICSHLQFGYHQCYA